VLTHLCSPAHLSILLRRDLAAFLADVRRWALSSVDRRRMDQLAVLVDDTQGFHLFEAIERAKKELSAAESAEVTFTHPGIEVREPVTRAGFEEASQREVAAILACLEETVRAAGVRFEDVGVVCCTGGTARVPRLAAELRARMPRRASSSSRASTRWSRAWRARRGSGSARAPARRREKEDWGPGILRPPSKKQRCRWRAVRRRRGPVRQVRTYRRCA
jgi:hypothetical protein